ncbi:DUF4105 domain-containing protein [Propionivibrio dicarboxylicus]|uniref:Lnb N-terminal periplasmic domain-containing protein n=1 Tax=Propionivibrio dicarboxylicus TaxID=83767 RepID=UPI00159FA1D2|nr:DUF4105 domain-containing protein [Propionivibrio dicarboxylicus]
MSSAIHSPDFFLAEHGRTDPEAELAATLAAMLHPLSGPPDAHAKCRFPARLMWLREQLAEYREALADIECPAFAEWVPIDDITSISLVFANGYLDNPASYYGHLFLKFNKRGGSALADQTANFGAIETRGDNPALYIVKGIAGGYDGGFSPVDYFFHDANYRENELRDLWEYRLDLSPHETRLITAHSWEVLNKRYAYYFFHDNCAYRVAELLEIVDTVRAIPRNRPWIAPQAVIQQLFEPSERAHPLVAERIYHPSRQTRLHQRYTALNAGQRTLVADLIDKREAIAGARMQALSLAERHEIIDTLIDYHQYRRSSDKQKDRTPPSPGYLDALGERLRLPPGLVATRSAEPTPPEEANAPSWIQAGTRHGGKTPDALFLRLRPAYYDALDVSGAQAGNSGLSMGEIRVDSVNGGLALTRLDVIAIDSVRPAVTGLPGDRGIGWRLRAGGEEDRIGCTHCSVARIQADYTVGMKIDDLPLFTAFNAGGALQSHTALNAAGFARLGFAAVTRPTNDFGMRLGIELRRPLDARLATYTASHIEARRALGGGYDLRFLWERDAASRLSIGIGRYW